jgi:hypothetical protein
MNVSGSLVALIIGLFVSGPTGAVIQTPAVLMMNSRLYSDDGCGTLNR